MVIITEQHWTTIRKTLQRYGQPASYKKWWMRKFEFTMRHAVHVHEISKRVFMFPKLERIKQLIKTNTSLSKLTSEDWMKVEFRGDRLASYSCIIINRCIDISIITRWL